MKTLFVTLSLALTSAIALADPSPKGPDFSPAPPRHNIDSSLAASDGTRPIMPSDVIAFRRDSDTITPAALTQVTTTAEWLDHHRDQVLVIEGRTDKLGTKAFNADLALRRADAVRTQLMLRGVSSDRIVVEVFGEVGAVGHINELDRAVVMSTSLSAIPGLVDDAIDQRGALRVLWTDRGTQLSKTHDDARARRIGRL